MFDLDGLELTGTYGTWSGRVYEIAERHRGQVLLLTSAEVAPGPDWTWRDPDHFFGEGNRWQCEVPAAEVTGVHRTVVQGSIEDSIFDLDAQRDDGDWAVSTVCAGNPLLRRLGLQPSNGKWSGWAPVEEVFGITRTSHPESETVSLADPVAE